MKPIYDECPRCNDNLISYMPLFSEEGKYMEVDVECPNCGWSVIVKADVVSIEKGE